MNAGERFYRHASAYYWNAFNATMYGEELPSTIDAGTYHPGIAITTLGYPHSGDAFKRRECTA